MRIGLVIYGSLDTVSGGYLYDRKLLDHLRRRGDEVEIFPLPWRNYARHLGHNLNRAFARRLQHARLDVLLQDELNHPSLFRLNQILRPAIGCPIISIVHHLRCSEAHPRCLKTLYRQVERRYLHTVDGFIFNSAATRAAVEHLIGPGKPFVKAHPGGDRLRPAMSPEAISARARQAGPLCILFLGNIIPRKGLHTLLDALALLPTDARRLTIIGNAGIDPKYTRAIRRQIERLDLQRRIDWLGHLPDPDLKRHLEHNHVLAVPSSYEGFGIVYLEAMGFGLPVIAGNAGGAVETVRDGANGFLIPPDNATALAERLRTFSQDRERLAEMGVEALQTYRIHPTWDETCARISDFLVEMAA